MNTGNKKEKPMMVLVMVLGRGHGTEVVITILDILSVRCLCDMSYLMAVGYKVLEFEGKIQRLKGRGYKVIR